MTKRIFRWMGRRGFQRRKLKGTLFHRLFGDSLLSKDLWRFSRQSVRKGWIIGCLVAGNPFIGIQLAIGLPLGILLRANLLVIFAVSMTTNVATIGPFMLFCYAVGKLFTGEKLDAVAAEVDDPSFWETAFASSQTALLGCLVVSLSAALLGALAITLFWRPKAASNHPPARPSTSGSRESTDAAEE